jgi:hypothetical protein
METSPEQKLQTEMQTGFTVPLLSQANFLKSLVADAVERNRSPKQEQGIF